jgi:hypothetical protein
MSHGTTLTKAKSLSLVSRNNHLELIGGSITVSKSTCLEWAKAKFEVIPGPKAIRRWSWDVGLKINHFQTGSILITLKGLWDKYLDASRAIATINFGFSRH